jgi:extracellular solute-binding protein (family 5)
MAAAAFVACTGSDGGGRQATASSASSGIATPTAVPSVAPRHGGVVRIGFVGSPATLDPYSPLASDLTYALARPVYPSLYELQPDGTTRPSLARHLEHVTGGVRVFLKRTRWSDGSPIVARDVLASIRRARAPSGFARIRRARRVSQGELILGGRVGNWRRALATLAFVVPNGVPGNGHRRGVGGGPFRVGSYTPGLKLAYKPNRSGQLTDRPLLDKVIVEFVDSESVLLQLLHAGRLDAAAPPSTLNLADRLDGIDVEHDAELGWEAISLELEQSIPRSARAAVVAVANRQALVDGLVRDDGVLSNTLHPGPNDADGAWSGDLGKRSRVTTPVRLSAPAGDELTGLLQRALQIQLTEAHVGVEPLTTSAAEFYGLWRLDDPADVAILRRAGAPGLHDGAAARRRLTALPVAQVKTYLAWRPGVHGLEVNPTFAGPLWNAESWWLDPTE